MSSTQKAILIAFTLHQWLHKSAFVLCYTYIGFLFHLSLFQFRFFHLFLGLSPYFPRSLHCSWCSLFWHSLVMHFIIVSLVICPVPSINIVRV